MENDYEVSVNEGKSAVNPANVVLDLLWLSEQCEQRCMLECSQWVTEQLHHLPDSHFEAFNLIKLSNADEQKGPVNIWSAKENALIKFIRSLILNKNYNRAKFFLSKSKRMTSLENFLYYFSWYMICIRSKLENDADDLDRKEDYGDIQFSALCTDFEAFKKNSPESFDCFLNYLLGLIRKRNGDTDTAIQAFYEAIQQDNRCWPAWESLATLVDGYYVVKIEKENCSRIWLYNFFVAETMFRLQLYVCAIDAYTAVSRFVGSSPYIYCQIAAAQSVLQEHDTAISSFQKIRKLDPYRIEQMHFYSDSLYIRQNFVDLSTIAKWFYDSHKFHWETCCIVANYYSAKNIHEQAQEFLKRAIRLCPMNASIWVLLGHEFLETKNHQAAAAAYRKATAIDQNCYRGWYGLGQLFEILKQSANALYFYQKAHKCKPDDSRMLIALGVTYSKLNRKKDAEKCFKKAFQIGDVEGNALIHLAKLYEEKNDNKNAAKAYEAYLTLYTEELVGDLNLIATACRFLARHNLDLGNLDISYDYAQRCLNFDISKEEGNRILSLVRTKRSEDREKTIIIKAGTFGETPIQTQRSVSFRTPIDAPRPIGGGDDSSLHTPALQNQREVNLTSDNMDDMSITNSDDNDLDISF